MRKYVTKVPYSNHHIYKLGFGTYDILNSGLEVSQIEELLSDFINMGGNVIDTSRYDIGHRGSDVEEAQKLVGRWCVNSKKRLNTYLVSKTNFLLKQGDNKSGLLTEDLNESLKNLSTDYIDLFLVNGDDETTEISSIINKLEDLKKEGKILSYGCSNWKPHRIRQAMEYARDNNLEGFTVNQMLWNIGSYYINEDRMSSSYVKMTQEMFDIHKEFNILAMPYSSLAGGFFAKLYLSEVEPESIDIEKVKGESPYYTKKNLEIYEEMKNIGNKYIASPGWVALGYLFNQNIDTCSILSIRNLNQLKEAFEAIDRKYTFDDFKSIDMFNKDEVLV